MHLFAFSANHTNMALAERERLALTQTTLPLCYGRLSELKGVAELYLLSTCNRTEIYACCTNRKTFDRLIENFAVQAGVDHSQLLTCAVLEDDAAVVHLLRVACGIHSMVLGEPQIFGQIKSAYSMARRYRTLGSGLEQLMQFVFSKVKEIRTAMPLGREPVSIAFTMVKLVQQIFDSFADKRLLLVGAGETIELAARHLCGLGIRHITISNRTLERADELAQCLKAQAAPLYDLPQQLTQADLVVTATSSQLPIIGKGMVEGATKRRHGSSLVLFDLAVPRDVEPQVGELEGVFVYTIDDLGQIIGQNKAQRQQAAAVAEKCIAMALEEFQKVQQQARIGREYISPLRSRAEGMRDTELRRAMRKLATGEMPESVVFELAHSLTKKLLHIPSVQAKKLENNPPEPRLFSLEKEGGTDSGTTRH